MRYYLILENELHRIGTNKIIIHALHYQDQKNKNPIPLFSL